MMLGVVNSPREHADSEDRLQAGMACGPSAEKESPTRTPRMFPSTPLFVRHKFCIVLVDLYTQCVLLRVR
jgi:hypothetical protein